MKILVLSRYSRMGASSRLRTLQYLPYLRERGLDIQVEPFFDDQYVQGVYSKKSPRFSAFSYFLQRLKILARQQKPDVIWLEKEALPWVPWPVERLFLPRGVPIVTDIDDAIFHRYDCHRNPVVRTVLGRKIGQVMGHSRCVTAGNAYLADHAKEYGAPNVEVVPTVVDIDVYGAQPRLPGDTTLRVGWIGTPYTWQEAGPIYDVLHPILEENSAVFRAVGAKLQPDTSGTLDVVPWTEDTEVELIQSMDVGIMPLNDTPWARGKCGYKLIQYMACGLPVIASPVGVNARIVEHGVNGFLASTDAEWREALSMLMRDPELRARLGAAGRKKVEEKYSLQVWGPRVAEILSNAAKDDFL